MTNEVEVGRMQIAETLQESQAHLTGIIASAMDAIITVDSDRRILIFNEAAEKMFGYSAEQVMGSKLDLLLPERFRDRHQSHIRHFGETGVTSRRMGKLGSIFGQRSNGEEFMLEASISQVQVGTGKLFTVILRDVTERVQAEEKLIESEQRLRATIEQAAVGIAHAAPDGRWLLANQKFLEILGYSEADLLTLNYQQMTHPDDLAIDIERHHQLLSGVIQMYSQEKRYIRKGGMPVWVNLTVSLVRDLSGEPKYFIKVIEDITVRKEVEAALKAKSDEIKMMTQQLWQTAKLATMGELAASIAHELNNPLAILSLRVESLLGTLAESANDCSQLEIMSQEIDRMASLVANLLQFSRSGQRQISSLDIEEEIERTLELLHNHLIHRHITVQRKFAPVVPLIQADRQQLRQLFLNLLSNSSDAMPNGGTLIIQVVPVDQNQAVVIEITDTGVGIRPEDLRQVLEPFFTTKPEGKGTGLGLAICRRIVEEHRGTFHITSPGIGKGASVQIKLPGFNESKPNFLED